MMPVLGCNGIHLTSKCTFSLCYAEQRSSMGDKRVIHPVQTLPLASRSLSRGARKTYKVMRCCSDDESSLWQPRYRKMAEVPATKHAAQHMPDTLWEHTGGWNYKRERTQGSTC